MVPSRIATRLIRTARRAALRSLIFMGPPLGVIIRERKTTSLPHDYIQRECGARARDHQPAGHRGCQRFGRLGGIPGDELDPRGTARPVACQNKLPVPEVRAAVVEETSEHRRRRRPRRRGWMNCTTRTGLRTSVRRGGTAHSAVTSNVPPSATKRRPAGTDRIPSCSLPCQSVAFTVPPRT